MLFEKRYYYYLVKTDNGETRWYRSLSAGYRAGTDVIIPISDGIWGIGVVTEKRKCRLADIPNPLEKTKGIVKKAGWLGESEVRKHNNIVNSSACPVQDISVSSVETGQGRVSYITCEKERAFLRESILRTGRKALIVETYPPAEFDQIPREAQAQILRIERHMIEEANRIREEKRLQKAEEDRRWEEEENEEDEMEDLDKYN